MRKEKRGNDAESRLAVPSLAPALVKACFSYRKVQLMFIRSALSTFTYPVFSLPSSYIHLFLMALWSHSIYTFL
jgi:hypothetical protein